jgi:hypothetical protein
MYNKCFLNKITEIRCRVSISTGWWEWVRTQGSWKVSSQNICVIREVGTQEPLNSRTVGGIGKGQ